MTDLETGDRVTWAYGTGTLGTGTASGTVIETGLEKFGYDDVIHVDPDESPPTHVRPKDLID